MFIEQISGQYIKIKFDINEKQLLLGDILKITASGKNGVLVQVLGISTVEKNPNFNLAESKILFTVENSGKLINWQGNIPSQDFMVKKLSAKEILMCSNTLNTMNPVPLGTLALYPDTEVELESAFFENTTVIYCDKQSQKDNILNILACELSKNHEKTVLIDFNGEYSDLKVSSILEAGNDIKLPFDTKGLSLIYNKCLSGVSSETRAVAEDIFIEIENYLSSGEIESVPFSDFIDAVNSVYETNKIPELVLLKNKLSKLQKHGIFADKKHEITNFSENVKNNALVIIDLSKFPQDWQKELLEFLIDSNTKKYKQNFFLLLDSDKINADKNFVEKLCGKGNKNGINPIIISGHESESAVSFLSYAKNIIAFAPENMTKITALKDNLIRLNDNEAIVTGKITNNVPLYINIYDSEIPEKAGCSDNSGFTAQVSPEIYLYSEPDDEELKDEKADEYDFNYSNQFDYNEASIELIKNISELQEEVVFSKESVFEKEDFSVPQQEVYYEDNEDEEEFETDEDDEIYIPTDFPTDLDKEDVYNAPATTSSFYDAVENENHYKQDSSKKYDSGFSEDDLSDFFDDDDEVKENLNINIPEEEGDEDFDYDSSEEFRDESVLDYAGTDQQSAYGSFYDDTDKQADAGENLSDSGSYNSFYDADEVEKDEVYELPQSYSGEIKKTSQSMPDIPVYSTPVNPNNGAFSGSDFEEGDKVSHEKYGLGTVTKIIGSNEKRLCSIQFDDVGRRLLDPKLAGLEKIS